GCLTISNCCSFPSMVAVIDSRASPRCGGAAILGVASRVGLCLCGGPLRNGNIAEIRTALSAVGVGQFHIFPVWSDASDAVSIVDVQRARARLSSIIYLPPSIR